MSEVFFVNCRDRSAENRSSESGFLKEGGSHRNVRIVRQVLHRRSARGVCHHFATVMVEKAQELQLSFA